MFIVFSQKEKHVPFYFFSGVFLHAHMLQQYLQKHCAVSIHVYTASYCLLAACIIRHTCILHGLLYFEVLKYSE